MESSVDIDTNKKVASLGDRPYTAVYLFSQLVPIDDAIYYFSYSPKRATINHFRVDESQSKKKLINLYSTPKFWIEIRFDILVRSKICYKKSHDVNSRARGHETGTKLN